MLIKCDVLVVGAGPAGLSAALVLSNKGCSTVVLEKNKTVGPKHTKYDITEGDRICGILDEIGIKANKTSSKSEWFSPHHSFLLDSKIEDYYFKRGHEEDSLEMKLLNRLQKNDVKIFFEANISEIRKHKENIEDIEIICGKDKIRIDPQYIVAADGPESGIRKSLKIRSQEYAKFVGHGYFVNTEEEEMIPHARIYFDITMAPGGYVYSGSVGRESFFCVVIDDIFNGRDSLERYLRYFLEKHVNGFFSVRNHFSGIGISGVQDVVVGNVLFVGGAGFFYDPFFGYGLNYAIESAYFAAKAVEKNDMEIYKIYSRKVQKEIKDMFFAREIWREADNDFFDRLIMALNGKLDAVDERIDKILELFEEN
jgi:flavin-dependent dehydrogenase